jgi:hypothetical protein
MGIIAAHENKNARARRYRSVWQSTPDQDGFIARFHALRRSGIAEIDMFAMPLNASWMPWLRKWKNDARGCPNSGVLSAWSYNGGTCF